MKSHQLSCLFCALSLLLGVGCEIQVNDPATGFSWEWTMVDVDNTSRELDCASLDADFSRIVVTASDGETYRFTWQCQQEEGSTDGWEFATGAASFVAQIGRFDYVTGIDHVIAEQTGSYDFKEGAVGNFLGSIGFVASRAWDPSSTLNEASVAWDWKVREGTFDTYEWFTQPDCEALGIDYARVWIYSEMQDSSWSDPSSATFSCVPKNGTVPPGAPANWTGFYASNLLEAGRYKFEVGYFRDAGDSSLGGVLLATDVLGSEGESELVQIDADSPSAEYSHLSTTLFTKSEFDAEPRGDLAIELAWSDQNGSVFADENAGDCSRYVAAMGYSLVRDDMWIASSVALQDDLECLTSLVFSDVPATHSYELVVVGDSVYDGILWENSRCSDLTPVPGGLESQRCIVSHVRNE